MIGLTTVWKGALHICLLTFNIGDIMTLTTLFLDIAFVRNFDVCAIGAVYFHRFYMFHSFIDFHRYVCLFHLSVIGLLEL